MRTMPSRRFRRSFIYTLFSTDADVFPILIISMVVLVICGGIFYFVRDVQRATQKLEELKNNEKDMSAKLENIEKVLRNIKKTQVNKWQKSKCTLHSEDKKPNIKTKELERMIVEAVEEYYNKKCSRADFALESAGGKILNTGDTEQYNACPGSSSSSLFGVTLCEGRNSPKALIQANVLPGECWAFKGSSGFAVIQLIGHVFINGVTLEHISKTAAPTGEIDSAPKQFSIWGLNAENDVNEQLLGQFLYDSNGPPAQYFEFDETSKPYLYIKFKVHSNHGNNLFTCVYRLQVHGKFNNFQEAFLVKSQ